MQDSALEDDPYLEYISDYNKALKELCDSRSIGFIDNTDLVEDQYYEEDGQHFKADFIRSGQSICGGGCTMMSKGQGAAHIMKFVVFALIIGFVVLLMLFASGSNKPFEEVSKSVEDSLDTEALTAQDAAMFKRNFGLNAADYAGVLYYSSGASMSLRKCFW